MFKKRLLVLGCILLLTLLILFFMSMQQMQRLRRDPVSLMNKYYQLKKSNPKAAQRALLILLNQDNNYLPALKELSQWYINENNLLQALPLLQRLHDILPGNRNYTFQLAYLYHDSGAWQKARPLFLSLDNEAAGHLRAQAQQALAAMASYLPYYNYAAMFDSFEAKEGADKKTVNVYTLPPRHTTSAIEHDDQLLNRFYALKKSDKPAAAQLIKHINQRYPNHVLTLKEGGFLAIADHQPLVAIDYFTRAYNVTYQPNLAMQLGYLYDQINNKPKAYQYFKLATRSGDPNLALSAQNAMTNLRGLQTKAWSVPYFSELFFTPFSQSRFGLTVRPFIARAGVEQNNRLQTKEYLVFRRTDDNQSANLGKISQIYEDDVQITGMGAQIKPFYTLPISAFIEAGIAYDLIYKSRDRWRGDLRSGVMYYNDFGARPAYFDKLTVGHAYYSDWYGDATYFSRYGNNVIGGVRTHQGIRLLQYKSSMVNLYVTGRALTDTQRQFFNNFAEIGPGIAFVPSNRFNVELRIEHINGAYLPAGATPNPYGQYYTNNIVQLLCYVKM